MKVLALSHSAVAGAYREKFRRLAKRKGWDLHLALPHAWPEGGKDLAAAPGREGRLQIHVLKGRLRGRIGFASLAGLGPLAASLKPDLIYVEEEPFSLGAYQALRAARACGAAFVFYTWENMDRGYKPPLNWVRRQVLAASAAGVAGNREGAALLRSWGFTQPLLTQPQYGIDAKRFKPARRSRRPFTVGYFGRLVQEKGVDLLLKAAAKARVAVRIGGQGPEERALRLQCDALGVDVRFEGFVPFERRASFFAGIDALALPSRTQRTWKEQFGRVLAEGMACGVPCIGSDSGAIPEVIGEAGLIAREEDVEAWSAALEHLASSPALRQRLGRAARQRALQHFEEGKLLDALGPFLEKAAHVG
jgi:glycosyltransferase involved in cell wall biosynthesis